jgi:outer membrane protein assembly factor BamB
VESESIVALDRATGKPAWRADGIRDAWNAPILVSVPGGTPPTELVVAMMQKIVGLDPATGARLWSCDTGINWYMVPNLVADADGVVYCIGGRSGGALAVRAGGRGDVTASHRLWTGTRGSNVSSPVLSGEHLYWAHENRGEIYCAKAKTGEIVYEQRLDRAGQIYASPVLSGGNLYYTTREGRTWVVAAGPQFKLLSMNELEPRGTFNSSPAVAGGRLYLRSNKFLYCIGER